MAHGTLLYRQATVESMIAEEESTEQKSLLKEAKEPGTEQIGLPLHHCRQGSVKTLYRTVFQKTLRYSKGFYDKPYNPPDLVLNLSD